LKEIPNILQPTSKSPVRFEIPLEMMKLIQENRDIEIRHIFPFRRLFSIIKNIHISVDSIQENPAHPNSEASNDFLEKLKNYSFSLGVGHFKFVKLPRDLIFRKFGVLYDNAIIMTMEMSKALLEKAPSQATMNMVFGTYDDLGIAANKIAEFLREHGYSAQADHPLGGLVLFPPLAQKAGIGWVGNHGLLITPEFGPRVRLAAIYTNIENLPFKESKNHGWIEDYCKICGVCIRRCPPKAIHKKSISHDNGLVTHISQQECFEYFAQYYGCSICIKVCPFSKSPNAYDQLKMVLNQVSSMDSEL
jgi:Pyruvate/2-oxoacid:ferredoxin oxidoreductase delta subunit